MRGFQNKNHSICEVGLVLESLLGDLAPRCSKSLATKFVLSTRQLVVGIDPLCDQYCCENHSDFEADETMNGTMVEICYLAAGCYSVHSCRVLLVKITRKTSVTSQRSMKCSFRLCVP